VTQQDAPGASDKSTLPAFFIARNVVNLYAEPSTSAEVVSQAIMGDTVDVIDQRDGFSRVHTADQYTGWVGDDHLAAQWDRSDFLTTSIATLFADVYSAPDSQSDFITKLVVSSRVTLAHGPAIGEFVPLVLPDKTIGYVHNLCLDITHDKPEGSADLADPKVRRSIDIGSLKRQILRAVGVRAIEIGRRFIGTPYLWGGCTPFGIDCSGFVQLSYKLSGLQLLRDAQLQFNDRRFERCDAGQSLDESDLLAGDLVAFQRKGAAKITHIGMALGDGRFIHSSGGRGVNIERCDSERYSATYVGAVRLSPNADLGIESA
jgi:hypothetical protein